MDRRTISLFYDVNLNDNELSATPPPYSTNLRILFYLKLKRASKRLKNIFWQVKMIGNATWKILLCTLLNFLIILSSIAILLSPINEAQFCLISPYNESHSVCAETLTENSVNIVRENTRQVDRLGVISILYVFANVPGICAVIVKDLPKWIRLLIRLLPVIEFSFAVTTYVFSFMVIYCLFANQIVDDQHFYFEREKNLTVVTASMLLLFLSALHGVIIIAIIFVKACFLRPTSRQTVINLKQ